jgi:prepilin signal peptidase PulO-like enzyme (type II secretory pathway)
MQSDRPARNNIINKLRNETGFTALLVLLFLAGAFWLLQEQWSPLYAALWLLIAAGFAVYQFAFLWQHLADNHDQPTRSRFCAQF